MSSQREAEYKRDWIGKHDKADEIVCDAESKQPVCAIYYYPPTKHVQEMKKIWKMIGAQMELERLQELEESL